MFKKIQHAYDRIDENDLNSRRSEQSWRHAPLSSLRHLDHGSRRWSIHKIISPFSPRSVLLKIFYYLYLDRIHVIVIFLMSNDPKDIWTRRNFIGFDRCAVHHADFVVGSSLAETNSIILLYIIEKIRNVSIFVSIFVYNFLRDNPLVTKWVHTTVHMLT